MQKQVHVIFSGRVQGVGFRFSTMSIARHLSVRGWVRNLAGSSVELVADGEEKVLQDFIRRIEGEFSGCISDRDVQWSDATGEFQRFEIR